MSGQLSPNTTELRKLFESAEKDIENNLLKITARAKATKKYMTAKRREVRQVLSELKKGAFDWTDKNIPTYYKQGVGGGIQELGLSGALATGALHKQTITALSEGLNNRFADVTGLIGRRVDDIYRTVQLERAVSTAMGHNSVKQAAKQIREDLATRGVTGFVDKSGRRWNMATYADMAARTVAAEATRRGKWNEFIEHGEDLVRVSNHSTECELCAPWEDAVLSITGKTPGYPTVNDAMAAGLFHPNCVVAGTEISARGVQAHYSRWYAGNIVTLISSSGNEVSCTPNHPILTSKGWVAAGSLNKGDQVVEYVGEEGVSFSVSPNEKHIPTLVEDIPSALVKAGTVSSRSVPVSTEDFHGDGGHGNVNIVRSDGLLWADRKPLFFEPSLKDSFRFRLVSQGGFFSPSSPSQIFRRPLFSSDCVMCGVRHLLSFFRRFARHPFTVGFCLGFCGKYPRFTNSFDNGGFTDTKGFGDCSPGLPRIISPEDLSDIEIKLFNLGRSSRGFPKERRADSDFSKPTVESGFMTMEDIGGLLNCEAREIQLFDLVDVDVSPFSGHVYNLQTENGWYASNSIITHNCMHSTSLAVSEILKEEEKREREEVREFVPAGTIEEANAFAQSLGIAKHVDYLGVDLDVANEFNKRLVWYRDNVKPELLNMEYFGTDSGRVEFRLKQHDEWAKTALKDKSIWPDGFTLKQKKAFIKAQRDNILMYDELPARAMAGYSHFDEAIIFKEKCFFSQDRILEIARCDKGFTIVGDKEGITATLDHEMGHALDFRSRPSLRADPMIKREWSAFEGSNVTKARQVLSEYALDNQEEFIAESWAEFMNHESPRDIAARVGARILELVRRNP